MAEKMAPVQGYSAGIPWHMHLRAYDAYSKKWSPQPAMIDLEGRNCRGGFSTGELDDFIPGWREELSELNRLRKVICDVVEWWYDLPPNLRQDIEGSGAIPGAIMRAQKSVTIKQEPSVTTP